MYFQDLLLYLKYILNRDHRSLKIKVTTDLIYYINNISDVDFSLNWKMNGQLGADMNTLHFTYLGFV